MREQGDPRLQGFNLELILLVKDQNCLAREGTEASSIADPRDCVTLAFPFLRFGAR